MRFFKSFRLLHRRTKSDGDITTIVAGQLARNTIHDPLYPGRQNALNSTLQSPSLCVNTINFFPPLSFDPIDLYLPPPSHAISPPAKPAADYDILNLEAELATLRKANHTLKTDLAEVIKEATDIRTALYAEMSASAYQKRQMMLASQRIQDFTLVFARYEAIDQLLASIGLHKAVLEEALAVLETGQSAEEVIVNAVRGAKTKVCGSLSDTTSQAAVTGSRYKASLNMTLRVRKELKGRKKVIKFWKQVAQQGGKHEDIITPSPSDISSIQEPLSAERQKAVHELITKRRECFVQSLATMSTSTSSVEGAMILTAYQISTNNLPSDSDAELPTSMSMSSSDSASTVHAEVITSLPPLASDSIKLELAQHSAGKRFSRDSIKRIPLPSVLRPIDLNVPPPATTPNRAARPQLPECRRTYPILAKPPLARRRYPSFSSEISSRMSSNSGQKSDSVSSARSFISALSASLRKSNLSPKRADGQDTLFLARHSDDTSDSTPFDNSAFCSIASDSGLLTDALESESGTRFSDHIMEVSTRTPCKSHTLEHGSSLGQISEESTTPRDKDTIFAEAATPTTAATTPSKTPVHLKTPGSSPTKKSKLPVLKYLRRLSPLPSPVRIITKMHATSRSEVSKRSRGRPSSSPTPIKRGLAIPTSTRRPTFTGGRIPVRKIW